MKQRNMKKVNPVRSSRRISTLRSFPTSFSSSGQVVKPSTFNGAKETIPTNRSIRVVKLRLVGQRLDLYLATELSGFSREQLKRFIQEGKVEVNGRVVKEPKTRLGLGDTVAWGKELYQNGQGAKRKNTMIGEVLERVGVIAETEHFIVLSKPAGLSMHPVRKGQKYTLTDWLSTHYPQLSGVGELPERPGMVHRLDKDTSGIVLIAKTQWSFMALKGLFQDRKIQKEYLALVYGTVKAPSGVIDKPLGRVKGSIRRATPEGKRTFGGELREAETEYALHTRYPQYDLLSVKPKTGRTHQIRVHLASLGHPIVGDRLYRFKEHRQDPLTPPFQLLHAASLRFRLSGKNYRFEAPLPAYFQDTLSILALSKVEGLS